MALMSVELFSKYKNGKPKGQLLFEMIFNDGVFKNQKMHHIYLYFLYFPLLFHLTEKGQEDLWVYSLP